MNKIEEKNKNYMDQAIIKVENYYNSQKYKEGYEAILEILKENSLNLKLLHLKMKFEHQLKKYEECLCSCNLLLFLQPNNLEGHQIKLNILKNQQKFNYLSDCLVAAMTLFPNNSFT